MRTGLAKELDDALAASLPDLLEPAGFSPAKKPRVWEREADEVRQIVALWVDGRNARDGYLVLGLKVGVTYPWEQGEDAGPYYANRRVAHQFSGVDPTSRLDPEWRVEAGESPLRAMHVVDHLRRTVLPALDRWRDARKLRDHFLGRGELLDAIELSHAVGDTDLVEGLVRAWAEQALRKLGDNPNPWNGTAGHALTLAADHGVELPEPDRAALLDHLRVSLDVWRTMPEPPDWVAEQERRFLC